MWSVTQQPWTLTGAAILTLLIVLTVRSVWPEKRRFWWFLLPVAMLAMAFTLDHFVETDLEKVHARIKTIITAIQDEDYAAIDDSMAPDYSDNFHNDKAAIMAQAKRQLTRSLVEKTRKVGNPTIKIESTKATILLNLVIRFEKDSYIAQSYRPAVFLKFRLFIAPQSDGSWLINSIDLLEVDRQPFTWRQI